MKALFYFHENSRKAPWQPAEDRSMIDLENNLLALADGATRNIVKEKHNYPKDFYAAATAELFVKSAQELQEQFDFASGEMDDMLHEINKRIYENNQTLGFDYEKLEQYWKPECVGAVVKVVEGVLYYGVMEDVYLNVLRGEELSDQVNMSYTLMKAFQYAQHEKEKDPTLDFEKFWCTKLRNNPDAKDAEGNKTGWGSFNGEQGASAFWQTGKVELKPGDIILLLTDGALDLFNDSPFNKQAEEIIFKSGVTEGVKSQEELSGLITQMVNAGNERLLKEKSIIRTLWNLPPIG
ncbi:MAG: hypothetical protein QY318_01505 [Candidatus Dojkabacteria bacterium]|nr:MAG: hypothetical protein QY318_01505 [Candidatus Dojkabacteria bacterium]